MYGNGKAQRFIRQAAAYKGSNCLEWPFNKSRGYGAVRVKHGSKSAHRLVCELVYGEEPEMVACHKCDNPGCVNPSHLYWGTYADNNQDTWNRDRQPKWRKI